MVTAEKGEKKEEETPPLTVLLLKGYSCISGVKILHPTLTDNTSQD